MSVIADLIVAFEDAELFDATMPEYVVWIERIIAAEGSPADARDLLSLAWAVKGEGSADLAWRLIGRAADLLWTLASGREGRPAPTLVVDH